jgi:hypothetical protein
MENKSIITFELEDFKKIIISSRKQNKPIFLALEPINLKTFNTTVLIFPN